MPDNEGENTIENKFFLILKTTRDYITDLSAINLKT